MRESYAATRTDEPADAGGPQHATYPTDRAATVRLDDSSSPRAATSRRRRAPTLGALPRRRARKSGPARPARADPDARRAGPPGQVADRRRQQADRRRPRRRRRARRCRLYNYADYIGPGAIKASRRSTAYNVKVRSRRSTTPTRLSPRSAAAASHYDIYFPSYDQISRLVAAKLLRPLNHCYIPNIKNVWPTLHQPVVRPGVALLRARTPSTPPASAGGPTR